MEHDDNDESFRGNRSGVYEFFRGKAWVCGHALVGMAKVIIMMIIVLKMKMVMMVMKMKTWLPLLPWQKWAMPAIFPAEKLRSYIQDTRCKITYIQDIRCQISYVRHLTQVIPYTEDGMALAERLRAVAHELERVTQ